MKIMLLKIDRLCYKIVKQIKNIKNNSKMEHKCEYCHSAFSSSRSLKLHINSAKYCKIIREKYGEIRNETANEIDINSEISKLKNKIIKKDKQITKLIEENKILKEKLIQQDKDLSFRDGKIEALSIPKIVNNNNCTINKLKKVPITNISPLSIEYIREKTHEYTHGMFLNGPEGLIKFIVQIMTLRNDKGETEFNYTSTDKARNSFHRLLENEKAEKGWEEDIHAKAIMDILNEIIPITKIHQATLDQKIQQSDPRDNDFIFYSKLKLDINPMYNGIIGKPSSLDRISLLKIIKPPIRSYVCI